MGAMPNGGNSENSAQTPDVTMAEDSSKLVRSPHMTPVMLIFLFKEQL